MLSMTLTEFFKDKSVYSWAAEKGIPGPRLAEHILYEKDPEMKNARRMGPQLAAKVAVATAGQVRFSDLRPDLAEKIREALKFEAESHG